MNDNYFFHPSWPLFFQDNHLLVLYKPAGLLVQADRTGEESLLELGKSWLKEKYDKPGRVFLGMVHRLDRPVAGVVLFCRTSKAAARLNEQFRSRRVRKRYLAVVEGRLSRKSGELVHQLERREGVSSRIVEEPTPGSREARLVYGVLDETRDRSLVKVDLETGRHHQIRLQLAHLGHPVLGDLRYGASAPLPEKQIALLAAELEVDHPVGKERLLFRCPLPLGWPWPAAEAVAGAVAEAVAEADRDAPPWDFEKLRSLARRDGPEAVRERFFVTSNEA